jgi:cytochrome c oxidase cbb3-type subunit IV
MKTVIHNLENIVGVEVYPIISLSIFFGFFVILMIYIFTRNKKEYSEVEKLPLDD